MDCGYKKFQREGDFGNYELYTQHFVMRRDSKLKQYKSSIGGHFVLMVNGFIVTVVNWILLIEVLICFYPYVFNPSGAIKTGFVVCYLIIALHFAACTWLGCSMLVRSIWFPYNGYKRLE